MHTYKSDINTTPVMRINLVQTQYTFNFDSEGCLQNRGYGTPVSAMARKGKYPSKISVRNSAYTRTKNNNFSYGFL